MGGESILLEKIRCRRSYLFIWNGGWSLINVDTITGANVQKNVCKWGLETILWSLFPNSKKLGITEISNQDGEMKPSLKKRSEEVYGGAFGRRGDFGGSSYNSPELETHLICLLDNSSVYLLSHIGHNVALEKAVTWIIFNEPHDPGKYRLFSQSYCDWLHSQCISD